MPSNQTHTDSISPVLDIIDFADRNQNADVRDYAHEKVIGLIQRIQQNSNYADKEITLSNLNKIAKQLTSHVEGGKVVAYITNERLREELEKVKPDVEQLEKGIDDRMKFVVSEKILKLNDSDDTRTTVIYSFTRKGATVEITELNKKAGKALYENPEPIISNIGQYGLYEASYGIAEQQKSLAQAVTQAKGHTSSLNNVAVLDTSGNKGAPLNGQANPDQDKTKVVANGK